MIIQGAAELLAGGVLLAVAIGTPILFNLAQQDPDFPKDGAPPEEALVLAGIMYGVLATLALLAAVLHIWAGIGTLAFRSRMFAIVSLAVGFVSICTCYCAPTSVAVGVYGLVVLLNAGVAEAFQQRAQGASVAAILESRGRSEPVQGKPE